MKNDKKNKTIGELSSEWQALADAGAKRQASEGQVIKKRAEEALRTAILVGLRDYLFNPPNPIVTAKNYYEEFIRGQEKLVERLDRKMNSVNRYAIENARLKIKIAETLLNLELNKGEQTLNGKGKGAKLQEVRNNRTLFIDLISPTPSDQLRQYITNFDGTKPKEAVALVMALGMDCYDNKTELFNALQGQFKMTGKLENFRVMLKSYQEAMPQTSRGNSKKVHVNSIKNEINRLSRE